MTRQCSPRHLDLPVAGWGPSFRAMFDLSVSERRVRTPSEGERRLLAALLDDAVRCYRKYAFSDTRRGRRLFREVEAWFTDPWIDVDLTFEYVCTALGIDAIRLRSTLERWRARRGRRRPLAIRPDGTGDTPTGTDG